MNFGSLTGCRPLATLTMAALLSLTGPGAVQAQGINLAECRGLWFSTSEDFLSQGQDLPGGQVVSDGDLLSYEIGGGTRLCARNADLMRVFDIERYDHGLDAVEQIAISPNAVFIAFSTEIDSVNGAGQFTAGDLLFGNGVVVPNNALLAKFDLPRSLNLGLDAVHIEGGPREKRELMAKLDGVGVDEMRQNPGLLIEILEGTNTDILFSTEGTPPDVQQPQFLDGDLLSAKNGTIVRSNNDLLPGLPSGLPSKGVDYGLDAYTPAFDQIEQVPIELFSIEIQARDNSISDGDALLVGPGIYLRNRDLIASLEPLDSDMGLDALAAGLVVEGCADIRFTAVSTVPRLLISGGLFQEVSGPVTNARPFGGLLRLEGVVPGKECDEYSTHEFRVVATPEGGGPVPVVHTFATGPNAWRREIAPCPGLPNDTHVSDNDGWFTLVDYWRFADCPKDPSLAIYTSPGSSVGRVTFHIELRPIGVAGAEVAHDSLLVEYDNIAPNPVDIALFSPGETVSELGNQCKVEGDGSDVILDVRGTIFDDHFNFYSISWWGGDAPPYQNIPVPTGTAYNSGRPDLGPNGTIPLPGETDVLLGTVNLTTAHLAATGGLPLIECGYVVWVVAYDLALRGGMNWGFNAFSTSNYNRRPGEVTFCLVP